MSQEYNERLLERAAEMIDYWEGTPMARVLENDIKANDLEQLNVHVFQAEGEASREEFYAADTA